MGGIDHCKIGFAPAIIIGEINGEDVAFLPVIGYIDKGRPAAAAVNLIFVRFGIIIEIGTVIFRIPKEPTPKAFLNSPSVNKIAFGSVASAFFDSVIDVVKIF